MVLLKGDTMKKILLKYLSIVVLSFILVACIALAIAMLMSNTGRTTQTQTQAPRELQYEAPTGTFYKPVYK